jgi:hypothetical protein
LLETVIASTAANAEPASREKSMKRQILAAGFLIGTFLATSYLLFAVSKGLPF